MFKLTLGVNILYQYRIVLVIFIYIGMLGNLSASTVINIPKPRSTFDISYDYHTKLLNMALTQAAKGREIPLIKSTMEMSQGRAIKELVKGNIIDLYWLGTNKAIEQELRAIRVPTTKGLIGYRKFIIRQDSIATFDKINSINDLISNNLVACQGAHWPDTDILRAKKLAVTTAPIYENIFKMLAAKRCDYFPRGYHDVENELTIRKELYPNLISYQRILLHYPFAIYFFTNKANESLSLWIEEGLKQLAQKGEIESLMKTHPLTSHIFPLKNESDTRYLDIENPLLPSDTNFNDPHYWILPQDFNIVSTKK